MKLQQHAYPWTELGALLEDERWHDFPVQCQDDLVHCPAIFIQLLLSMSEFDLTFPTGIDFWEQSLILPDLTTHQLQDLLRNMFQREAAWSDSVIPATWQTDVPWLTWPSFVNLSSHPSPQSWVQGVLDDVIRELPIDRSDARALQPTEPGECKLRPECNICGKTLFDKHSLKKHVDVVHFNIRRFQCQSCPKRFSMKNDLEGHVSAVHHRIKTHICDTCGLGLSNRSSLRSHKLTHRSDTKIIQCVHCGSSFRHMSTYRKHISRVHEFNIEKRVPCEHCGKMYNHQEGLKRHIKKFHSSGEAKVSCSICRATFAFKYELNRHCRKWHELLPLGDDAILAPANVDPTPGNADQDSVIRPLTVSNENVTLPTEPLPPEGL